MARLRGSWRLSLSMAALSGNPTRLLQPETVLEVSPWLVRVGAVAVLSSVRVSGSSRAAKRGGVARPDGPLASAHFEQACRLPASAWRSLGPAHIEFLLPLGDIGQHRPEPLVLHDRRLIDPLALVEHPIGQLTALVFDRQTPIRIVADHHTLTRQGTRHITSFGSRRKSV